MCQRASRERFGSLAEVITPCSRGTEGTGQSGPRTGSTVQKASAFELRSGPGFRSEEPGAAQLIAAWLIRIPATGTHPGPVAAMTAAASVARSA